MGRVAGLRLAAAPLMRFQTIRALLAVRVCGIGLTATMELYGNQSPPKHQHLSPNGASAILRLIAVYVLEMEHYIMLTTAPGWPVTVAPASCYITVTPVMPTCRLIPLIGGITSKR